MAKYQLQDADAVYARIAAHPSGVLRRAFYRRLVELVKDPFPRDGDVLEYKDGSRPNSFTASFGDGLVVYQVMRDYPVIFLWDVLLY